MSEDLNYGSFCGVTFALRTSKGGHHGIPEGVDANKIEANFKKGVLTITLPKKASAQKPATEIDIKAA